MPRGKIRFARGSGLDHDRWLEDPEAVVREVAERNNAKYIEGSLVFAAGGAFAEVLIETVEPEPDSRATQFIPLATELGALEMQLFIGPHRWMFGEEPSEDGVASVHVSA